jgi:hypothetical protein
LSLYALRKKIKGIKKIIKKFIEFDIINIFTLLLSLAFEIEFEKLV